jgi:acyl-coenzyme A synthetase/AMP-(fatty) acid ligase
VTATPLGRLFVSGRAPGALMAMRDGVALPFGRFAADVAHTACVARAVGIARGAVLSADPYRFLVGLFGLMHAGATVVLPPDGLPGTLASLRDRFDAVLCDTPESLPEPVQFPVLAIEEGLPRREGLPVDEGVPIGNEQHGAATLVALDPATTLLEFFTSGSTGTAKRIVKPLAMLDREIATLDVLWGTTTGRRPALATVPFRHIFGLTFHLLWPLATGRPFASHVDDLWEKLLARDVADAVLVTSPAHLTRLSGIDPLPQGRRPARVFTAGAPLRPAQAREAASVLGVLPTEIFGSTETGAIATRTQHSGDEAWTPLPGIQVRTDDAGCMIVQSPFGPEGPPFVSADRIEMTPDGGFHFLGRADRIAKIEGKRVSLARLEQELAALPCVGDAAVVVLGGSPERLAAAVALNGDGRARLDTLGAFRFSRELRRQLSQVFEPAWLPKSWRFVNELPHGVMGKRREAEVKALFLAGPGRAP